MGDVAAEEQGLPVEEAMLEFALSNFIRPLCTALIGSGDWSPETTLTCFEVKLPRNGEVSIRLNEAETAWAPAWVVRDVAAGEPIGPSDLSTREVYVVATADTPFIRGSLDGAVWSLEFRFAEPAEKRLDHLRAADEFLASVHDDLSAGRLRAAFAGAFHAAEHYAKAELLHYPLTAALVDGSKTHRSVRSAYAAWAHLGNADERFAGVLSKLDTERRRATYLDGEWTTEEDLPQVVATLGEMQAWVTAVVDGRGPASIRIISRRPIDAGTLVGPEDVGLWRQR